MQYPQAAPAFLGGPAISKWPGRRPAPAEPLDPEMFDPVCPSSAMPIQIGDKWTAMVVLCLEDGRRRFTELRGPLRGVTPKVLTQTLRAMERDGLLTRTAYDENPPRVEYELTDLGRNLLTLIDAARAWSRDHLLALLEAREKHESTPRPALLRRAQA